MDPKVTVSVPGRFWAFDLAVQLYKRGMLQRLITTYPVFKAMELGIPRDKVCSILPIEVMKRLWARLPASVCFRSEPYSVFNWFFELVAASHIPVDTDIFVGWSGSALSAIRRANKLGAVTIVERGSTHIETQTELLMAEYRLHGVTPCVATRHTIQTELMEYSEADYIMVPSDFVKKSFLDHRVSEKKLFQIPYGVDLTLFRPDLKSDNVFRIVHCGQLTFRKGIHHLLQAFTELNLPNSELCLIGRISAEINDYSKRHPCHGVKLLGSFPQSKLSHEFSRASVFVLASIEEGLARVIPQAMACGLPVVCSGNTGGVDVVRHGQDGFIFPAGNVEALKSYLRWCYDHQDKLKEMGQSARQHVSTGFTWEDYGDRIEAVYRKILKEC
jgi:glycosyltransferase involved in cell wall biosynthesis